MREPVDGPEQKNQGQQADWNSWIQVAQAQQGEAEGQPGENGGDRVSHTMLAVFGM